jgi:hypothetical protein
MSGGSYDYLCHKDAGEMFEMEHQLQRMADTLAETGYAEDAAKETMGLLLEVRSCKVRLDARIQRLTQIWRAVEWWHSGDTGEEGVKLAIEEYRKG